MSPAFNIVNKSHQLNPGYLGGGATVSAPTATPTATPTAALARPYQVPAVEKPAYPSRYAPHVFTSAEITELLENYTEIPKTDWANIPRGTHIRYMKTDGNFRRGGFVVSIGLVDGKQTIQCANKFDAGVAGYQKWPVVLETVANIWKSTRSSEYLEKNKVAASSTQMADLEQLQQIQNIIMEQRDMHAQMVKIFERITTIENYINGMQPTLKEIFAQHKQAQNQAQQQSGRR